MVTSIQITTQQTGKQPIANLCSYSGIRVVMGISPMAHSPQQYMKR